ncbi:MAG: hypothetical protein KJN64_00455 [Ignavibacteria bacterium]|nr:hypothetical protein [Ignavibacteria bacterium]MBT8381110.1 hypothetical protein [Ignavibacteria bacterium]MBT8392146.1 hypothetical protein [Ignavibacteria bacterium]NNJ53546.1 hypothetical protein [Ignavibacteriaceae bacterium]NNL21418.1 hypothetical protein [Ignavibacteriaceae bacterium]
MKKLTFALVLTFAVMLLSANIIAQDGNYYVMTTWKFSVPEDGSNSELNDLMKEWNEKVVMKNDKIVSEKAFVHRSGADMRDWVFLSEYASWGDIEAANDMQNNLVEEGWPNEEDRDKFFDTFWKYVITHSDEILMEKSELAK